jgi:hypothetical protein
LDLSSVQRQMIPFRTFVRWVFLHWFFKEAQVFFSILHVPRTKGRIRYIINTNRIYMMCIFKVMV